MAAAALAETKKPFATQQRMAAAAHYRNKETSHNTTKNDSRCPLQKQRNQPQHTHKKNGSRCPYRNKETSRNTTKNDDEKYIIDTTWTLCVGFGYILFLPLFFLSVFCLSAVRNHNLPPVNPNDRPPQSQLATSQPKP